MTQSKKIFFPLLSVLTLLIYSITDSKAQGFSYVYIQGDKKTPIYTKVEGVMMPRYGKNYALLSRLAPGPMNVEILFQQNEYPPIQFNILVPENSKRAFVLQKKEDGFYLFDVEQNFYLKANNNIEEDHIPSVLSNIDLKQEKQQLEKEVAPKEEKITQELKTNNIAAESFLAEQKNQISVEAIIDTIKTNPTIGTTIVDSSKPKFITDIVFDNDNSGATEGNTNQASIPIIEQQPKNAPSTEKKATIINSDCNEQISSLNFARLYNSITSKKSEDEQLGLILESCKQNCFSTEQCQKLVEKLDSDIAKFTAIKSLYPKTTDQSNFVQLEELLTGIEWKEYFKGLVQP